MLLRSYDSFMSELAKSQTSAWEPMISAVRRSWEHEVDHHEAPCYRCPLAQSNPINSLYDLDRNPTNAKAACTCPGNIHNYSEETTPSHAFVQTSGRQDTRSTVRILLTKPHPSPHTFIHQPQLLLIRLNLKILLMPFPTLRTRLLQFEPPIRELKMHEPL